MGYEDMVMAEQEQGMKRQIRNPGSADQARRLTIEWVADL
jgi:hypothetical protein